MRISPRDLGYLRHRVRLACKRRRVTFLQASREIGVSVQALRALGTVRSQRSTLGAVTKWLERHPEPHSHYRRPNP